MTRLLDAHGTRLHALLYRLTLRADVADDLLQDLALRLAAADAFASARSPYAYARTAATRLAMDWHRQQRPRRRDEAAMVDFEMIASRDDEPSTIVAHREQWEGLLAHLASLGERDQLLLAMRYLDGCDDAQLAEVTQTTAHQARGLLHKALARLRQRATGSARTDSAKTSISGGDV